MRANDEDSGAAIVTLHEWLEAHRPLVIAFSGGVDSAMLLVEAVNCLGDDVCAVTAEGEQFPSEEIARAKEIASALGVGHVLMHVSPDQVTAFAMNPVDRCFHCKRTIFSRVIAEADKRGAFVADGTHCDDARAFRPGRKALKELGVHSPLEICGFTKALIREHLRTVGMADMAALPSCACLATRIPHGERVTAERLLRIDKAESVLRAHGFGQLRVRDHGEIARIELDQAGIGRLSDRALRCNVEAGVREAGYRYVTIDLGGYRTGSMDPDKA